jgi:hypothetical protein
MRVLRSSIACIGMAIGPVLCGCGGGGSAGDAAATTSLAGSSLEAPSGVPVRPAGGLDGRVIVGYQGWFGCPGDFDGATSWRHWFAGSPSAQTVTVDMLPDTSDYAPQDLCDTGMTRADGSRLMLFSSQNPNIVNRHFALMARYGIGGVALERFLSELQDPMLKRRADHLLSLVIDAATSAGVPFFISYDLNGANPANAIATIRSDWRDLDRALALTSRAAYLRDAGKPVLQIWGAGFVGVPGTPDELGALLSDLRSGGDGLPAATTIGGVPTAWRTLGEDAQSDPAWNAVYRRFDVISPWTVGRVSDSAEAATLYATRVQGDLQALAQTGVRYLPVVFAGFSWANLMRVRGISTDATLNRIPRDCGRLLWTQAQSALAARSGAVYVAMFDEFDEGTALLPMVASAAEVPTGIASVTRDQDRCTLPKDWYLSLVGRIAASLRGATALGAMPQPGT